MSKSPKKPNINSLKPRPESFAYTTFVFMREKSEGVVKHECDNNMFNISCFGLINILGPGYVHQYIFSLTNFFGKMA